MRRRKRKRKMRIKTAYLFALLAVFTIMSAGCGGESGTSGQRTEEIAPQARSGDEASGGEAKEPEEADEAFTGDPGEADGTFVGQADEDEVFAGDAGARANDKNDANASVSLPDEPQEASHYVKKRSLPEGFVYLDEAVPAAKFDLRYFGTHNFVGERIDGYAAPFVIATEEAAEALRRVQEELEEQGYGLLIYDAYRPQKAVEHFKSWAKDAGDTRMKADFYPDLDKSVLFRSGYIASRSGHSRGSTVDLTLVDLATGEPLDMGSDYDFFGEISHHGTKLISEEQAANRRLLRTAMEKHGFAAYSKEWWHYTLKEEPFPDDYFDFDVE